MCERKYPCTTSGAKALLGIPQSVDAPPEGLLLDPWLYPGARAVADPE